MACNHVSVYHYTFICGPTVAVAARPVECTGGASSDV